MLWPHGTCIRNSHNGINSGVAAVIGFVWWRFLKCQVPPATGSKRENTTQSPSFHSNGRCGALWQGRQGIRMNKLTVCFFIQIVAVKGDTQKSHWNHYVTRSYGNKEKGLFSPMEQPVGWGVKVQRGIPKSYFRETILELCLNFCILKQGKGAARFLKC